MKRQILRGIAACLLAVTGVGTASAALLIDTGQPLETSAGYELSSDQWLAGRFNLAQSATITGIEGWMLLGSGAPETLTIALYDGSIRISPSGLIYEQEVWVADAGTGPSEAWQGMSGLDLFLPAGNYYAAFEVRSGQTYSGHMPGKAPDPLSVYAERPANGDWIYGDFHELGIRVYGDITPVPLPAAFWLLGSGIVFVAAAGKRRTRSPLSR